MTSFPPNAFRRIDEAHDLGFYNFPRRVVHIDAHAIAALTALYRRLLPAHGVYLDLMSSWRSHLPADVSTGGVVGLGMNAVEMRENPQLDDFVVHDLNALPRLPFDDNVFDAVLCAVSVQYLVQPAAVFREVYRVLRPGGVFVVSFSNRCFPTKAVAIWQSTSDQEHIELVQRYFTTSGPWVGLDSLAETSPGHNPLYAVWAYKES
jgi:SAM-dependent methyltransferase